jgi:hypothetical protein
VERKMQYTTEQIEKIIRMGKRWQKGQMDRIYFEAGRLAGFYGLEWQSYDTGNIMSARLDGQCVSNSEARRILSKLGYSRLWFDLTDAKFHCQGEIASTGMFQKIVAAIQAAL